MADFKERHKMISTHQRMKAYCSEPLSHIENYDKAHIYGALKKNQHSCGAKWRIIHV